DFNQVFSHPELAREYPDIVKNTKFVFYEDSNPDFGGGVLNYRKGDTRFIGININFSEARTTNDRRLGMDIGLLELTIHEIQHILQNRELERKGQQPIIATGASLFARIKEGTLRIFQPDGTV